MMSLYELWRHLMEIYQTFQTIILPPKNPLKFQLRIDGLLEMYVRKCISSEALVVATNNGAEQVQKSDGVCIHSRVPHILLSIIVRHCKQIVCRTCLHIMLKNAELNKSASFFKCYVT